MVIHYIFVKIFGKFWVQIFILIVLIPQESSVERFSGRVSSQKSKLSLSLYNFESQVLNFHLSADVTQEK